MTTETETAQDELERVARRVLRDTPEYEAARSEGCARDWLDREAGSAALMLYEHLMNRLESLDL